MTPDVKRPLWRAAACVVKVFTYAVDVIYYTASAASNYLMEKHELLDAKADLEDMGMIDELEENGASE